MIQGITGRRGVDALFGLHGTLHNGMMRLERLNIVLIGFEDFFFDALTQAILSDGRNNFTRVLFLDVNPADHLIEGEQIIAAHGVAVQFIGLDHGLANGGGAFLERGDHGGIIKNTARDLTMSAAQPQDQMQRGFFLNVVITEGTTIFELFAGKNQTLLIRWNALLVLNFRFDIVNRVGRFDIERNCLAGQGFDKNLKSIF